MEELLGLAIADPHEAARVAERMIAESRDPLDLSYAYHGLGIVLRDEGKVEASLEALRAGVRLARASGSAEREMDVRATYGTALVLSGRARDGLAQLDQALGIGGAGRAKVLMRRASVLALLGRYADAAPAMRAALSAISAEGDAVWEARTRIWLGHILLALGQVDAAQVEVVTAEQVFRSQGLTLEHLTALENLADVAAARGDLASALRIYGEVLTAYRARRLQPRLEPVLHHADVYLRAGLPDEAVRLLEAFGLDAALSPYESADYHLRRAEALLAAGAAHRATAEARLAKTAFRRQERSWFELRANLVELRARDVLGERRGLARDARLVAAALDADRAEEAPVALTIAGRLTRGEERLDFWRRAASYRSHPNALVRAGAWQARALEQQELKNRGGVLRACAAGLDAIDEHRRLAGSSELRALATSHGRELTTLALRHAATEPRALLRWSERTRATALAQPPATSDATTIPASLAALRENGRRLAEARLEGEPTDELERERLRLERAVRAEHHTLSAVEAERERPATAEEIVGAVGDGCLVELVDVDGTLHVLVVHGGRVRRHVAGSTAAAAELLEPAQMLLRRASRGRPADMTQLGVRLQEAILGEAVRLLPDGPVVLAPTARLHGLAWSLLAALHDRPFSVVPSSGQWLRAKKTRRPRGGRTVLVAGPGLGTGGAEVPVLAKRHPDAVLLDREKATVDAALEQLDGAALAHIAAHGTFRADSPLFSALELADGPLTVHDLERLRRAPYRVVLSACESGVLAPVGAEELLGLAAALFSLGTAGLVSSVAEVNDEATATLMVTLHERLAAREDLAHALLAVRREAAGDPVAAGTAAAFLALGV